MKTYLLTSFRIAFLLVALSFAACNDDDKQDSLPPNKLSNIGLTPLPGGALISYNLPQDGDVAYVRADYTNTLGAKMFKVASSYHNEIRIDGFNDTQRHTLSLVVVDHAGNESEATLLTFTPQESYIQSVLRNIQLLSTFGGIKASWTNPAKEPVYTLVSYIDQTSGKKITNYLSSSETEYGATWRGFETKDYEFFLQVEDYYGNKTEEISAGTYRPLHERVIEKSKWLLVQSMSVNGDAWEGRTVNVWDNVIDTKESNDDNSYCIIARSNNGGQLNFPLDIVIDMGQSVQINRLKMWQRAFWYGNETQYLYYQKDNVKAFELHVSNDLSQWQQVGSFDIGDPKKEDLSVPQEYIDQAIEGHEFNLPEVAGPFRYLKFRITENYGSESEVCFSELTLYGG